MQFSTALLVLVACAQMHITLLFLLRLSDGVHGLLLKAGDEPMKSRFFSAFS